MHSPLAAFQILAVPPEEAMATADPSAENAAESTSRPWPARVRVHSPLAAFQILAAQS